jgi:hypothetical protein
VVVLCTHWACASGSASICSSIAAISVLDISRKARSRPHSAPVPGSWPSCHAAISRSPADSRAAASSSGGRNAARSSAGITSSSAVSAEARSVPSSSSRFWPQTHSTTPAAWMSASETSPRSTTACHSRSTVSTDAAMPSVGSRRSMRSVSSSASSKRPARM